jgi:hypothetical protein
MSKPKKYWIVLPMILGLSLSLILWAGQGKHRPPERVGGIEWTIGLILFVCGPLVWLVMAAWPKDD